MKKTITLLITLVIIFVGETKASKLFLRAPVNQAKIFISGQTHFSQNGQFVITELREGRHHIELLERTRNRNRRGNISTFRGKIYIPHRSHVYARITPRGTLVIDRIEMRPSNHIRNNRGRGIDYGRGTDYNTRQNSYHSNRQNNMFNRTLNTVHRADFENNKKNIARRYISNNRVTSREVLMLMRAMNFESSRIAIAKQAYRNTIDPENYHIVYNGFQYRSSENALDRFLR